MIDFKSMLEEMNKDSLKYSYGTSKEEAFTHNIQGSMIKTINEIYS